jgi:CRP/FNR family transcriptional regulator, cyclic AMP receptor protein
MNNKHEEQVMELVNILKGVELFHGLDTAQLGRLANISQSETYNTDDVIFSQGSPGDKMYVVTKGQVEIRFDDHKGSSQTGLYLGEGQIFGEMALLDQGVRSASVLAIEDGTTVYGISSADFLSLCKTDTAIGYVMMRNMALDLSFKLRHKNLDPSAGL